MEKIKIESFDDWYSRRMDKALEEFESVKDFNNYSGHVSYFEEGHKAGQQSYEPLVKMLVDALEDVEMYNSCPYGTVCRTKIRKALELYKEVMKDAKN